MAAIYTGIHAKLKSPRTPWPDKLKLARYAWISTQCHVPNKEQVLLDWASHALTLSHTKKVELAPETLAELWAYFDDILHSQKLRSALSQGRTISLRLPVTQVINARILECISGTSAVSLSTVLSCCHGILSSPVLSVIYTAKYELLVELLSRLSSLGCSQLAQQPSGEPLQPKVFEVLLLALNTYLTVQRQQANSGRVFALVTAHLLQPLCLLRHLLSSRAWTEEADAHVHHHISRDIRGKVDAVLHSALFSQEHLQSYKDELLPSQEESEMKKVSSGKGLLCPVNTILAKLCVQVNDDEALSYAVRSGTLPLLFKFSLDTFCKGGENKLVCFHLMTKLLVSLGFTDELSVGDSFDGSRWGLTLLAVESLLNSCLAGDVYNVAADKIKHGDVQLTFYRKVARLLFNNAQTGIPAWYRCLRALLALNHHILESDLDELLSSVWVDADCVELRVRRAREVLVTAVLQTYAKLRQLRRLFEELLVVICRPAADELRLALLSDAIQKILCQCFLDSPPSLSLEVCRLILEKLRSDFLPYLDEKRDDAALKLFSVSLLLHTVLFSLKTLDNTTPVPIVRQTQTLMKDMLEVEKLLLLQFDHSLSMECVWSQKVQEVTLLLAHTWIELDTVFQIYCIKYTSPAGRQNDEADVFVRLTDIGQVASPIGKLLQKFLALSRMKKVLLRNENPSDGDTLGVLHKAAQFIVGRDEPSLYPNNHVWDLQLCSVNSDTYAVASWFTTTSNLPLIAPYLTEQDVSHLAENIVCSLLHKGRADGAEKHSPSIPLVSKHLLESIVLCELPQLYSAVVKGVREQIIEALGTSQVELAASSLLTSCYAVSDANTAMEGPGADSSSSKAPAAMRRLKAIAQEIVACAKSGSYITLSETQLDDLLDLLTITNMLVPDAMSPEDYSDLFLLLFFVAMCVQSDGGAEAPRIIRLLKETLSLMVSLLLGKNSLWIFKIEHGSNLLETALTSLSSRGRLFQSMEQSSCFGFLQSVQDFIQCLLQILIHRRSSVRLNLEKFSSFMAQRPVALGTGGEVSGNCHGDTQYLTQLHLATFSTLCHVMTSSLGKSKQLDETLIQLLEKTTTVMGPAIQALLLGQRECLPSQSFIVDVVTVMLRSEFARASHQNSEGSSQAAGEKLYLVDLYRGFGQQILRELCSSPRPMDFLISSIRYLSVYIAAAERAKVQDLGDIHLEILQNIHKLLSASWLSVPEVGELEAPVKDLLSQLVGNSSQEQFNVLLLILREGLITTKIAGGLDKEVLATVTLTKLLAACVLPEPCSKAFWLIAPQIISALVFIVRESSSWTSLTPTLTVPTLEALTVLLRRGEGVLSNSHHILSALGALMFVPLESASMETYHAAFRAVHEALFAVIQCHPQVMLKAAPSFLGCFHRLVTSIMHEGRQRGEPERALERDGEVLLKCARLVERMYSHIAAAAEGFTVLSSFVVAQYVSELQRVTLQPDIKKHLTEGIYRVLDLCVEQDVKFLNTSLQMGVKEVFSELYSSYTHYHKAQRQGEEKYTV